MAFMVEFFPSCPCGRIYVSLSSNYILATVLEKTKRALRTGMNIATSSIDDTHHKNNKVKFMRMASQTSDAVAHPNYYYEKNVS